MTWIDLDDAAGQWSWIDWIVTFESFESFESFAWLCLHRAPSIALQWPLGGQPMEQSVLAADSRVILFFEAVEAALANFETPHVETYALSPGVQTGNMFELEAQQILSDAALADKR